MFGRLSSMVFVGLFLSASLTFSPVAWSEADPLEKTFSQYNEMRDYMLEQMASGKSRVWLYTEFLTDGDIATALFVAKYRKLDVQVMLAAPKAQKYMSRLINLKNNNIVVYFRPPTFEPNTATVLLVDDRLYSLDGELDFLAKSKGFQVFQGTKPEVYEFAKDFALAMEAKNPAIAKQIPVVGRGTSTNYQLPTDVSKASRGPKNLPAETREAYHYGRDREKKPHGVPDRLPKSLKWQGAKGAP